MALSVGAHLGPYEIVSPLGAGGMGEVYKARDPRLDRTVAVKVLAATLKADLDFRDRFEREARAVAALNHPNICTLYDVGRQDEVDYLVMEYLDGETIAALVRRGPLPLGEWVRLATQMASALEAAHEQHVIHRDIKSANVFVTSRGQVKVLDFGLAKRVGSVSDQAMTVTRAASGLVVTGTIEYMSPEQARGLEIDQRTDLFSLGIVLYEMAAGVHPFRGADFIDTLNRIANVQPTPITATGAHEWAEVDRIISTCLEKDPHRRYGSATELLRDLARVESAQGTAVVAASSVSAAPPVPDTRSARRRSLALPAVALLVVAIGVGGWWWRLRSVASTLAVTPGASTGPAEGRAAVRLRRSVAVFGFQNLSGREEDAWLSTALAEMLSAELGVNDTLRVVAGQNVARVKRELTLADGATLGGDTLMKVRSIVGADLVLRGSYLLVPGRAGQLRVVLNVQDASAGETIATVSETGTRDGILQLVSDLGGQLRRHLGLAAPALADTDALRARLSTNADALRLYVEGLERLRSQGFVEARDTLTKAIAADPANPLIRAAMADVWAALGYDRRAEDEAARAVERAQGLAREDRLSVEARYHEMAQHWDQAVLSYRTLTGFYPDNVDYGLGLAGVLTKAGRATEALTTIAALRGLPAPASDDVRIDLAEAEASHQTSNYPRELAAGQTAADRGLRQGARLLVAQGRLAQAQGHLRLGRPGEAARLAESARQLFIAGGDRSGEARALNRIANIAYEQGDYAQAKKLFQDAATALRAIGNLRDLTNALNNTADTMMMQDELAAAKPIFGEALQIARERADSQLEGLLRLNLGELAYRQGDLAEAQSLGAKGLELARTSGYTYTVYMGLLALGNVALARGDLAEATTLLEEGATLARGAGDQRYTAYIVSLLGDVALADGRVAIARQRHEEALRIRLALGGQTEAAESQLALARIAIAEGRPAGAEASVRSAIDTFKTRRMAASEAHAWAVQSALALSAKRASEAGEAADAAERLLPNVQSVGRRLSIAIQIARARAAQGRLDSARASLGAAVSEARQRRFVWLDREGQQALSELR